MGKHLAASLFEIQNYREYIRAWARTKGRGEYRKIALALKMHTTLVSQVMGGRKCLTEEQASQLCVYMRMQALETDYFLNLVQLERAGSETLKQVYLRQLKQLRALAGDAKCRVPESRELGEQDRATFYSSWQYAVVRLLTGMKGYREVNEISSRLNLPISRSQEILDFLVSRGLCEVDRAGYRRTKKNTHVEASSPLSTRHHQNWRTKSLAMLEKIRPDDLAFTAPISLAEKDIPKVKAILLDAIADISRLVEPSSPEEVIYLGIDWLKI